MKIVLAKPRGFCAGVERAIVSVEKALELYGPPVYVLNNIVHNQHVVNELHAKGAIFVKSLDDVPAGAHLLFSAHGVGPERWERAKTLNLHVIDATCPLVEKVHNEARRFASKDYTIILIGEEGHDETVGTMGWAPENILLVQTVEDVATLEAPDPDHLAYITQTTLSVNECQVIIDALKERFPNITAPPREDICYATTNRQAAVNAWTPEVDLVLVVGDTESANSTRLADIARGHGKPAHLILDASMIQRSWLAGVETLLLTSGASVPDTHVQGVIEYLNSIEPCEVDERELVEEDVAFRLPRFATV
ncbi:MAG: 4-hydroxy-3-methylbut-2-enyl diphosphate reductase [Candidatus Hydrogenedentes bacterium]|nr:4-hydroxy-3-methylbut-2-enyl diphosphate reductase [Candidatus Hydrogenedentota bacterium]